MALPKHEPGARSLTRLVQTVTASLALGEVLESVARAAMHLVADSSARIWVVEGGRLALKAEAGTVGAPRAGRRTVLALGEGLTGVVGQTREPLVADEVLADPRTVNVGWMREQGFVSYIGLPLLVREQLVGVLSLHTRHRHCFSADEIEVLTSFGAHAAIAINNARLFEETQDRRRAAETLARVARALTESLDLSTVGERIVASIPPLFGVPYSVLRLLQPDGSLVAIASGGAARGHFEPGHVQPPGTGLLARAVAEGRPVWSRDLAREPDLSLTDDLRRRLAVSGIRAFLAAPLLARGAIIGVLAIGDELSREFSDSEVTLLETFADQAALALENARLYEEVRAREAFIRNVLESLREGLVVLDGAGRVMTWNRGMEAIYGLAAVEAQGRLYSEVFSDLGRRLRRPVERLRRGEIEEFVLEGIERHTLRHERRVLNLKGSLLTGGGARLGAVLLVEDITDRVALARAARQAEKMAAVGTLCAGIAHEVNNPIGIITSRIEVMLMEAQGGSLPGQLREDLTVLHRNAQRVARITQALLSYARPSRGELAPVDLSRVVQETLVLVQTQLAKDGILVSATVDPAPPPVLGDANALQQVLLNLLTNSREAMAEGGEIRIELAGAPREPERIRLSVADTGRGIAAEDLPMIFDPFFTTKDHGTGLGLSVSYAIVRDHQGTVDVQSEPGKGTTFVLTFPIV